MSATAAAFANGALAHALDYEDAFDPAPTHPNASIIPAALAIAQSNGPIDGETFLTAMAIGCDLTCRLALSAGNALEEGGWYPPPILGAFGAAAAAARLMRFTPKQVLSVFSLMLCQTACPGEIKYSTSTSIRAVREAFAAQAAVISAGLVARGVQGFVNPFEGRGGFFQMFARGRFDKDCLLEGLGTRFHGEQVTFKLWPCCRGTHACLQAAQSLRLRHGFHWRDIGSIRLIAGEMQRMLCEPLERKRSPAVSIDGRFSLPFTVASMFVHSKVTLDSFTAKALEDPDVLALARLVEVELRPDWGRNKAAAGVVQITLRDGRELSEAVDRAIGHPGHPVSIDQLRRKFEDCATRAACAITPMQSAELASRILAIEHEGDVGSAVAGPGDHSS